MNRALVCSVVAITLLLPSATLAQERPATIPVKQEEELNKGLGDLPPSLDRTTPRRSWSAFLTACDNGKWEGGMHLLNLGDLAEAERKTLGAALTRQLCEVLKVTGQKSADELPDTTMGPMSEDQPRNYAIAATIKTPTGDGEIWLRKVEDKKTAAQPWLVTRKTVGQIQGWYQQLVKKQVVKVKKVEVLNPGLGKIPADLSLTSPRDAATTFADLARQGSYSEAAFTLDLSSLPKAKQKKRGKRLARRLALVLKRVHMGGYGGLSNDPTGAPETGVPLDEEVVARTKLDGEEHQIRLRRVQRADAPAVWVYSAATVAQVDPLYEQLGYGWAGDYLPPLFFDWEVLDVQLWQWLGLLGLALVALIFGFIASFFTRKLLLRLATFTSWDWDDDIVAAMNGPLRLSYWVLGYVIGLPFLALADQADGFMLAGCMLLGIMAAGWFLMRVTDMVGDIMLRIFKDRDDDMIVAMVPVARKIVKALIVAIVVIFALQNMGMDVGSLLAGLGIGGLAFALAAKTTLENLLGGITIAFDRPFKVGDYIQVGSMSGTVEDLGLRSTRIRTAGRSIITVPNGQMVDSKVENFAPRDRVLLDTTLGVQYDTSPDQIRYIIDEFKRYLLQNEMVYPEGWRVRFKGYGPSSQDIEVRCYVTTNSFADFTAHREKIYFDLGEIVAAAGAEFAFPSQTIYTGKDSHADADKARQAAKVVAERLQAGELCIPEVPEAVAARLKGK